MICVQSDQVAASEWPFGAMGAMVVQEEARAVGITALSGPISEEQDDAWFLYQSFATPIKFSDATGTRNISQTWNFDSKAQRKVEDGQAIVFMVENGSATDGLEFLMKLRILVKMH